MNQLFHRSTRHTVQRWRFPATNGSIRNASSLLLSSSSQITGKGGNGSAYSSLNTTNFVTNPSNRQQQLRPFSGSSKKRDFYQVLGVDRSVDKSGLKKAYFKLAKQYHPDANQGDGKAAERFKEITEAYEVLSDDQKREMYNQFGHDGVDPNFQQQQGPFGGAGFGFADGSIHFQQGETSHEDIEEIFDAFFGGGGGRRRRPRGPRRGADLQMQVNVTFEEAVFGTQKDLDIRYQHVDPNTNQVKTKERSVKVDIPAGLESGMNVRLKEQGAEGEPGAPNGNLLVQIFVEESDYYAREGAHVHTEIPISVTQAILGGTIDVKTLTGTVELKIPPGSQPGSRLVIRNRGIPRLNASGKGNHYVHLKVQIPKTITKKQEELLRDFDSASNDHDSFTGRVAHAAESAFGKIFGKDGNKSTKNSKKTSTSDEIAEDDEPKKQAAQ